MCIWYSFDSQGLRPSHRLLHICTLTQRVDVLTRQNQNDSCGGFIQLMTPSAVVQNDQRSSRTYVNLDATFVRGIYPDSDRF